MPSPERGPRLRELERRLDPARLARGVPLAPYTTFRIGGPADLLFTATGADDLAAAVTQAVEERFGVRLQREPIMVGEF